MYILKYKYVSQFFFYVLVNLCFFFLDIINVVKVFGGYSNGSLIVYICVFGFVFNGEDLYIMCNGKFWMIMLFVCFGEYLRKIMKKID